MCSSMCKVHLKEEQSVSVFMWKSCDGLAWEVLASLTAPLEHFVPIDIGSGFRMSLYVREKAAESTSSLIVIRFLHVWRSRHLKKDD